jgi:adsorption protein B
MHAFPLWTYAFGCLSVILLLSGVDDLIPVAIVLWHRLKEPKREPIDTTPARPPIALLEGGTQRRIAIFVPCWRESAVIGNMVRHNLAAIQYANYDFFLGVYPNDPDTVRVAQGLAAVFPNVHVAITCEPGPTSKADCLNCIFKHMTEFEKQEDAAFDTVVLHDAEDIIHPDALSLIDRERYSYAMVQVPVLPIATPLTEITHGVYIDEFSEFQTIDMRARQYSRSFVPSNGVGTGFAREILDQLAAERGEVFDAASLTEDYEIGVHIHAAGYKQTFAKLRTAYDTLVATREYFPRTVRTAIRQRTRWVTGIALQCWERRGWRGSWRTKYWYWRDRKGLWANPVSLLTNLLFLAGLLDWAASAVQDRPWIFAMDNPTLFLLSLLTIGLQCLRITIRMFCVMRIFGLSFAMGVPLRSFAGNLINCVASIRAIFRYIEARRQGRKHAWLKTEHAYPTSAALVQQRGELSEVLIKGRLLTETTLSGVKALMAPGQDLGEVLLMKGLVSEEELCRCQSLHSGVMSGRVETEGVKPSVARSLPKHLTRRFGVLPVAVHHGRLLVAAATVPPADAFEEMKHFTGLAIDFQLVTRSNFNELSKLAW